MDLSSRRLLVIALFLAISIFSLVDCDTTRLRAIKSSCNLNNGGINLKISIYYDAIIENGTSRTNKDNRRINFEATLYSSTLYIRFDININTRIGSNLVNTNCFSIKNHKITKQQTYYKLRIRQLSDFEWYLNRIEISDDLKIFHFEYLDWIVKYNSKKYVIIPERFIVHDGILYKSKEPKLTYRVEVERSRGQPIVDVNFVIIINGKNSSCDVSYDNYGENDDANCDHLFTYSSPQYLSISASTIGRHVFEVTFENVGQVFEIYLWNHSSVNWEFEKITIKKKSEWSKETEYVFINGLRKVGNGFHANERLIIVENSILNQ